jgi:hypothetical protein
MGSSSVSVSMSFSPSPNLSSIGLNGNSVAKPSSTRLKVGILVAAYSQLRIKASMTLKLRVFSDPARESGSKAKKGKTAK